MADHSEPTPNHDGVNSRAEIPSPPIPHRRWLLDGQQLSLCSEKARPVSHAKHNHPEAKLWLFFDSVSGVFTSWNAADNCREVRLMGRQVFCVGAQVSHALHWETETSLIEAHFRPAFFDNIPADQVAAVIARESLEGAAHDRVLWELASTIRLLCSQPDQPEIRLLEPMMSAIARRIFTCRGERYAPKPGTRLSEDRPQLVIDHMEENIAKKVEAEDLAALVGLSTQHFTELFRNRTGRPPIEYLRELRRIEAHKLIFGGELRMGEIADVCGFCDEPHLNGQFKTFFGYSARLLRTRGQSA